MCETKKFSLINFDGAADVINNLIDKLADGASWIANHETPKRVAIDTYISDIQKSDYEPIIKAALISSAQKSIKEYCNQNKIVNIAMSSVEENAKPQNIDNDWIAQYMDKIRLVSDEEFQMIWGKILATECNQPNTIPRVLLHTLERMDREDAEAFTTLCSLAVMVEDEYAPIILQKRFNEYQKFGITYNEIVSLGSLGLIETDFGVNAAGYSLASKEKVAVVKYFENEYTFISEKKNVNVGNVIFTKSGLALRKAITVQAVEGFWEEFCKPLWSL